MQNSIIINKNSPLRKILLEMPVSKWKQTFPFSENVVYRMKSNLKHGQSINLPHNAVMNVYSNYLSEKTCMNNSEISAHLERLLQESKFQY